MDRTEVSEALPNLCQDKVVAVIQKLKELGITDKKEFRAYVKEDDLIKGGLLTIVEARKLIEYSKIDTSLSGSFFLICSVKMAILLSLVLNRY